MHIVSKVKSSADIKSDIKQLIEPIIGDIKNFIQPTDRVLLKPNFNTADPFPASTSLDFLQSVIEIIREGKPKEIIVGESCTYFLNTEKVCRDIGAQGIMEKSNVTWHNFDANEWVKIDIPGGKYFKKISIPKICRQADKIIFLPCLKTHRYAKFTMSLKISIGMLKPSQRGSLHLSHLAEKIAEVASVFKPDLIIMDGRKCFITGGPEKGEIKEPNVLLSGTDRIALDIEGLRILQSYKADNLLGSDPWSLGQIKSAIELNLGAKSENEYKVIEI